MKKYALLGAVIGIFMPLFSYADVTFLTSGGQAATSSNAAGQISPMAIFQSQNGFPVLFTSLQISMGAEGSFDQIGAVSLQAWDGINETGPYNYSCSGSLIYNVSLPNYTFPGANADRVTAIIQGFSYDMSEVKCFYIGNPVSVSWIYFYHDASPISVQGTAVIGRTDVRLLGTPIDYRIATSTDNQSLNDLLADIGTAQVCIDVDGVVAYSLCKVFAYLFSPDPQRLTDFGDLWGSVQNKPPFG